MESTGATRGSPLGARWFVRAAAVVAGLANLYAFAWIFGFVPGSVGMSFSDALPSVVAVLVAALSISELTVRRFGQEIILCEYSSRYVAVFRALCMGGALTGALLAGLWAVDGTMGANPSVGYFSDPMNLLGSVLGSWRVMVVGTVVGGFLGFLEGAVLAFPLAAALGWFGKDDGESGVHTAHSSGAT